MLEKLKVLLVLLVLLAILVLLALQFIPVRTIGVGTLSYQVSPTGFTA